MSSNADNATVDPPWSARLTIVHPPATADDSRVDSRVRDRVTGRVARNTRPRVSASRHRVGERSRPGRMARRCRSRVPASMTSGPVRVGCSVFLNNRYMDPQTGIFLSVDPLVAKTGEPYLYAAGNPTTLSDPSGLEAGCGATARGNSCSQEHAAQEHIRPSYLEGSTPKQSAEVRQVQDYANVCMNQWQWCVDSLANNDAHPIYGADGGLLGSQDLGLMSHAVALLMMLIGQGLAYIDGSGSGAVLRPGNLPNGNNTMGIEVYGTSVSDMTMVASTWHIGWRERFTPGLQMLSLIADGVAVIGGATCAFTAGVGCGVAFASTAVSGVANAGVASLNCTTGHQQTCGFAVAGMILSGVQLAAGAAAGSALKAGSLPAEFYQSLNAYSAITTSFFDMTSLNVPTGDGGEMGSVNIFRMTSGG